MAPRDKLENGVYILKSAARPWLPIQIGDIVDPETKARKITVEEIDENNKAKHWQLTYQDNGAFGYGHYTLQSQGEGLTGYYLTTPHKIEPGPELSMGQDLKWWSRCFFVGSIPATNVLSYEGFAATELEIVQLPPPATGSPGGNWGTTWNLWTPVKVA
ncbi:hypothetical protein L208DRAFT_1381862 [Tricholoma matsutake]|nr:hypothetical protein L208DRAFT_1381862 [Tricholoma matsutake 945]